MVHSTRHTAPLPQARDTAIYKYYALGPDRPVRVKLDALGQPVTAHTPDRHSGQLAADPTLLSRLELNWEAEEIDREAFEAMCEHIFARAEPDPAPAVTPGR